MKSKGFKIVIGVLAALIVVLGGLLVAKSMAPAGDASTTQSGKPVPAGAVQDDPSLPEAPAEGVIAVPDGEEA